MKPHGLDCQFTGYIPGESGKKDVSSLEAYIEITNEKTQEKLIVPMRSYVSTFLNILRDLFAGSSNAATRKSSVSWSGSTAKRAGIIIGDGVTPVVLSDDKLDSQITHASVAYGNTSFSHPYVVAGNPNAIFFQVKKLFSNNKNSNLVISELGLVTKAVGASSSSIAGTTMLSRDLVLAPTETPISVGSSNSIRFTFKFYVNQNPNGYGGLVLNFAKLIYNLYMRGNQNFSQSLLVNYQNQVINNLVYASNAQASSTAPFYLAGSSTQKFFGIVVGVKERDPDRGEIPNPDVSADERNLFINSDLTVDNCVVSSITNSGTNEAYFTISRTFTNNTASNIVINRVGLLLKGESNGTSQNAKQAFIAINKIDNTTIVPGQSYKAIYTFRIRA